MGPMQRANDGAYAVMHAASRACPMGRHTPQRPMQLIKLAMEVNSEVRLPWNGIGNVTFQSQCRLKDDGTSVYPCSGGGRMRGGGI